MRRWLLTLSVRTQTITIVGFTIIAAFLITWTALSLAHQALIQNPMLL